MVVVEEGGKYMERAEWEGKLNDVNKKKENINKVRD